MLALAGGGLLLRRRKRSRIAAMSATVTICVFAAAMPRAAHADINPNDVYDPNDFATAIISSTVPASDSPYSYPSAILGQPALTFNDSSNPNVQQSEMAKIVEPPYNYDLNGNPVITELPNYPTTTQITVQMGTPITHDPNHPYGDDLIVFGNSFYLANGQLSDSTDLNTLTLTGGIYGHPVQVSVSPDDIHWFSFPMTSVLQPYNAYQWNDADADWTSNELNPTIPLNPSVYTTNFAGATAASVLDAYGNSAGGTAFDLEDAVDANGNTLFQDGYSSIDYVQVSSTSAGYAVISAISAVTDPVPTAASTWIPEPGNMTAVAVGGLSLLRRSRA
jgi:hypothetical protein